MALLEKQYTFRNYGILQQFFMEVNSPSIAKAFNVCLLTTLISVDIIIIVLVHFDRSE